jgi:hypothetical protein
MFRAGFVQNEGKKYPMCGESNCKKKKTKTGGEDTPRGGNTDMQKHPAQCFHASPTACALFDLLSYPSSKEDGK